MTDRTNIETATKQALAMVQHSDRTRGVLARVVTNALMSMHQKPHRYSMGDGMLMIIQSLQQEAVQASGYDLSS